MDDLEPSSGGNRKVHVRIRVKLSELDRRRIARQREPHRLGAQSACAVEDQQLGTVPRGDSDRYVWVPVGGSKFTASDRRHPAGKRDLARSPEAAATAGDQIQAAAARRGKHVGSTVVVEVARLDE